MTIAGSNSETRSARTSVRSQIPLRRCRNAVLHVPRSGEYFDQRIIDLLGYPDSVGLIRTVHSAVGRLLLEEMRRRGR